MTTNRNETDPWSSPAASSSPSSSSSPSHSSSDASNPALPAPPTTSHGLLILSIALLGTALLTLAVAVAVSLRSPHAWDPLGEYPDQTVVSRVDGIDGPAARLTDGVTVVGTKCANTAIRVRGSVFWQSTTPPGILVAAGSGVATRQKGCVTETFLNPIPGAVRAAVNRPTDPVRRWVITGTETPVRDAGDNGRSREGIPRAWTTAEFEIVP